MPMPKPLPCAPSLRPFGEVILSGVATGPDTALQPRHGLLTPAMNINTYKKSIFPLKKRIELTPYLITPLCLSAVKRAAPPCFWLLVFLFFAPNFVLSSPPPEPCSSAHLVKSRSASYLRWKLRWATLSSLVLSFSSLSLKHQRSTG